MKIVKSENLVGCDLDAGIDVLVIEDSDHIECDSVEFDEISVLVRDLIDSFERDRELILGGLVEAEIALKTGT